MRAVGIITEYDPFHSGHAWQLAAVRAAGAEAVAVCMSGDLTQRGSAALLPPAVRARAALLNGADLVICLPNCYSTQSAEGFASAGVALLSALPGVDTLAFGAETPDGELLMSATRALLSRAFGDALSKRLQKGTNFAVARASAAEYLCPGAGEVLRGPNNNLGVEYCKAILNQGSSLRPLALPRKGAAHGQKTAGEAGFASASYLRGAFCQGGPTVLAPWVPESALPLYDAAFAAGQDIDEQVFSTAVLSRLRAMSPEQLAATRGTGEGLEFLLAKAVRRSTSLPQLYEVMKSKRYAHARLRRYVLAAALGYTDALPTLPPYLHVLGANKTGLALLKDSALPADTSLAALQKHSEAAAQVAAAHAAGADLAALCRHTPAPMGESYTQKPVLL